MGDDGLQVGCNNFMKFKYIFLMVMFFGVNLVQAEEITTSYTCSLIEEGIIEVSVDTPLCIIYEGQLQISGMDTSQYSMIPVADYPQRGLNQNTIFFSGVGELIVSDGSQTMRVNVFSPDELQFKIKSVKSLEEAYTKISELEFELKTANDKIDNYDFNIKYLREKNKNLTEALTDEGRYIPYYVVANQTDYERWMGQQKGFWGAWGDFIYGGAIVLGLIYSFFWYRARSEQTMA